MAALIRSFDWSTTPLGPRELWPQSLRTVVSILLTSRYQMWMAWGPELTFLCNDAYTPTLGIKHPGALGTRAQDVWAEIWPDIGPLIAKVLETGTATYEEGLLLFLERSGFPEETYHTFSYSPLSDDEGRISGMLCVVTEETNRLIGERRVETLRDVASALAGASKEDEVLRALRDQLTRNKKDLPFTLTYLFEDSGDAKLACSSGISRVSDFAPERIPRGSDSPWPAAQLLDHPVRQPIDVRPLRNRSALPAGDWNRPPDQVDVVPIGQQGREQPAGFFVVGINPYRRYDGAYSGFIDLLSGQIAAALGNARAYETERQRAEALAELDRAKTTFFSNVSHELRTPLTLMLSPVEELLAKSGAESPPDQRELLELVHRNGLRLQKLVNTLLDFSRIEAGRMQAAYEAVDLALLTAEFSANFRSAMERAGLEFRIECGPLPEPVYIDCEMWEKIVLNLLSNALKFTFEGQVSISVEASEKHARLTVADTGLGIAESELPHIFDRFHRAAGRKGRSIEGTGIGLALVQELVKLHGGSITVQSELSKGSTFTVTIPFGMEHLPKESIGAAGVSAKPDTYLREALRWLPDFPVGGSPYDSSQTVGADARAERILLADDNADMRDYVARLLSERYHVTAVTNGEQALEAALAAPPDLIVSDVMMPGLDGFELLKELRGQPATRTIPVVLLSARAGEESRVEGLGAGADDYLIKPFTAKELLARVGAQLAMQRRRLETEKQLQHSNAELRRANADLEQFAYSASHDLQEPLRQVAVFSQMLSKKYGGTLEADAAEYLDFCVDGAHRMETLISGLLAYSQAGKTSEASPAPVDMNAVVDEVKKNLATAIEESDAVISVSNLPVVEGDPAPFVHLLQNLISNALKYQSGEAPRVMLAAEADGDFWRFSVQDNGVGIPQEFQKQIFGVFKRLHDRKVYPGTGIGLAICQKIVDRYGGKIWVESAPGLGATFFFTLPRQSGEPS
jgi:signal transduction histidine kinase